MQNNADKLKVVWCLLEDELFASPIPTLSSLSRRESLGLTRPKIRGILDDFLSSNIVTVGHRGGGRIGPIPPAPSGIVYHIESKDQLDKITDLCDEPLPNDPENALLLKRVRDLVELMREYISSSNRTFWFTDSPSDFPLDVDLSSIVARNEA